MSKAVAIVLLILFIAAGIFFGLIPIGRGVWNTYFHEVQEVDDKTNYDTLKKVEDTCRSMIASYEADCLMYEQYKDSNSEEKQGWAEQAKTRANRTASTYNNYILENSYVWKNAVPVDIYLELEYLT